MLKVSDVYPSNFIAAGDLDGREVTLTIDRVADKNTVRREDKALIDKAVLYFKETPRGLVLGKTNAKRIRFAHGNVMDKWVGKQITVYPTSTTMPLAIAEQSDCPILSSKGKMATVPCLRVKIDGALADPPMVKTEEEEREW